MAPSAPQGRQSPALTKLKKGKEQQPVCREAPRALPSFMPHVRALQCTALGEHEQPTEGESPGPAAAHRAPSIGQNQTCETHGATGSKRKETQLPVSKASDRESAYFFPSSKRSAHLSASICCCIRALPGVQSTTRGSSRSARSPPTADSSCVLTPEPVTGTARIPYGLAVPCLYCLPNTLTWKAFLPALQIRKLGGIILIVPMSREQRAPQEPSHPRRGSASALPALEQLHSSFSSSIQRNIQRETR